MMMVGMPGMIKMLMMLSMMGGTGVPLGVPPAEPDRLMSLVAPEECLYYTTWSGTQAPDPDSENHTERLLAEQEVRDLISAIETAIKDGMARMGEGDPMRAEMADLVPKWGKLLLTNAACIYVSKVQMGPEGVDIDAGFVVHAGKPRAAEIAETIQMMLQDQTQEVEIDGGTYHQVRLAPQAPVITFGSRGKYVVAALGENGLENMFANVTRNSKQGFPKWLADLQKRWDVERVSTVSYGNLGTVIDIASVAGGPEANQVLRALGISNLTTYEAVTGLDAKGFVNNTFLGIDGEATGLLSCVDGDPITAAELSRIPQDTPVAIALRLDGLKMFDAIVDMVAMVDPREADTFRREMGEAEEMLGFKIREDLLGSLGDLVYVYSAPQDGGLITGWTGVVSVRDHEKLATVNETLIAFMRAAFQQQFRAPKLNEVKVGDNTIYVVSVPDDEVPVAPSWCLTEDEVIFALFPQAVKAHLTRGEQMESFADRDDVARALAGGDAIAVAYFDAPKLFNIIYPMAQMGLTAMANQMSREGFEFDAGVLPSTASIGKHLLPTVAVARRSETGIEASSYQTMPGGSLGATAPIMAALMIPAITSARQAARRSQSTNNLKQMALAMHNYHDVFRRFPPAYSVDEGGKPLLSWRVYILPFIEQINLFEEFHLNEPWDSEHNLKLIARMPDSYRSPASNAEPGMTTYLGVRGKSTVLAPPGDDQKGKTDQPLGASMAHIIDGSSNTIMIVEANDTVAVPWTKPEDFSPDPMDPFKSLHGPFGPGFLAAFADGSVQFLEGKFDLETLNNLFQRDDGNPVDIPGQDRDFGNGFDFGGAAVDEGFAPEPDVEAFKDEFKEDFNFEKPAPIPVEEFPEEAPLEFPADDDPAEISPPSIDDVPSDVPLEVSP